MPTASLTAAVSSQSKPVRIPSEFMLVSRISPAPRCSASRAHSTTRRPASLRPPCTYTCGIAHRIGGLGVAPRVDGDDDGLRAEAAPNVVDQHGILQRGGVHADLVRAGLKDLRRIVGGANTAADAKWNKQLARSAAHGIEQRGAAFVGRGNVEQDDFVGAVAGVARGLRGWVARVDNVDELHALHDAAVAHVEAGNDALGNH